MIQNALITFSSPRLYDTLSNTLIITLALPINQLANVGRTANDVLRMFVSITENGHKIISNRTLLRHEDDELIALGRNCFHRIKAYLKRKLMRITVFGQPREASKHT